MSLTLRTPRLTLRSWRADDRDAFAALNADPEVAADLGGPLTRAASDAKLERYRTAFARMASRGWRSRIRSNASSAMLA